jgi:hypothetical protein
MTAALLVLEPIFEADLPPEIYAKGARGPAFAKTEFATDSPLEGSGFELLVKEGSEAWVGEDGEDDVTQHRCRR